MSVAAQSCSWCLGTAACARGAVWPAIVGGPVSEQLGSSTGLCARHQQQRQLLSALLQQQVVFDVILTCQLVKQWADQMFGHVLLADGEQGVMFTKMGAFKSVDTFVVGLLHNTMFAARWLP